LDPRCVPRRRFFVLTAVLSPIVSVLVALVLSVGSDRLYLPVIGGLGDEPLSLFFFFLPVGATIGIGLWLRRSAKALWAAGFLVAVATELLTYVVWIGWIVVVCSLQDNACFD
jgi:hypothetical protein